MALASSHFPSSACRAGFAAAAVENLKRQKYNSLIGNYTFNHLKLNLRMWGLSAHHLCKGIVRRMVDTWYI